MAMGNPLKDPKLQSIPPNYDVFPLSKFFTHFCLELVFKQKHYGRTNGPTNKLADKPTDTLTDLLAVEAGLRGGGAREEIEDMGYKIEFTENLSCAVP